MAIANRLCLWLLLCTYKSSTVRERALLRGQQGSLPQKLDLGKRSSTTNAQKILVSVISSVCFCCRKSGVNIKILKTIFLRSDCHTIR